MVEPRSLVTCPCCHGRKVIVCIAPCAHCEETGTVRAEVDEHSVIPVSLATAERLAQTHDPDVIRAITKEYADVFRAAPKRRVHYDPRGLVNKPKPRKPPKRSRPRTRNARNGALRNPRNA